MTGPGDQIAFDRRRVQAMITLLERMAAGDTTVQIPLSGHRDELDAIAHAINVLADELRYTGARMAEAERRRVDALLRERDSERSV